MPPGLVDGKLTDTEQTIASCPYTKGESCSGY